MDLLTATHSFLFYFLSFLLVVFSTLIVFKKNPVYSSLYLALTMIILALIFFMLDAYFLAGVQMIVYAGAVIVLFVMVLMMFDLKKEEDLSKEGLFRFMKLAMALLVGAFVIYSVFLNKMSHSLPQNQIKGPPVALRSLTTELFVRYAFAFESLGVLLLVVAVGAVVISRIKGGTHARNE